MKPSEVARMRKHISSLTPFEKRVLDRVRVAGPEHVTKIAAALWSSDPTGRSKVCNAATALSRLHEKGLVWVRSKQWRLTARAVLALRESVEGAA